MQIASVRVNDWRLPAFPQIGWWGELAHQFGEGRSTHFDALAWYVEGMYHFDGLPWRPRLSYRYAWFSGDANLGDHTRRDGSLVEAPIVTDDGYLGSDAHDSAPTHALDPTAVMVTNINCATSDANIDCEPTMGAWKLRGLACRVVAVETETSCTCAN